MLNAIQTKLLITLVVLVAGISSYLAYEQHERAAEQRKVNEAVQRMRTEGQKDQPSGWAKSLKSK